MLCRGCSSMMGRSGHLLTKQDCVKDTKLLLVAISVTFSSLITQNIHLILVIEIENNLKKILYLQDFVSITIQNVQQRHSPFIIL